MYREGKKRKKKKKEGAFARELQRKEAGDGKLEAKRNVSQMDSLVFPLEDSAVEKVLRERNNWRALHREETYRFCFQ